MAEINEAGVPCYSGSCSEIYLEKAFAELRVDTTKVISTTLNDHDYDNDNDFRLKVAKELGETSLMLLVHPTLTRQNIKDTIEVVRRVVSAAAKQEESYLAKIAKGRKGNTGKIIEER